VSSGPTDEQRDPDQACRTPVRRVDKYNIVVGSVIVRADEDQERRIRALSQQQREDFQRIMGA
jgi:hypothetical protein